MTASFRFRRYDAPPFNSYLVFPRRSVEPFSRSGRSHSASVSGDGDPRTGNTRCCYQPPGRFSLFSAAGCPVRFRRPLFIPRVWPHPGKWLDHLQNFGRPRSFVMCKHDRFLGPATVGNNQPASSGDIAPGPGWVPPPARENLILIFPPPKFFMTRVFLPRIDRAGPNTRGGQFFFPEISSCLCCWDNRSAQQKRPRSGREPAIPSGCSTLFGI